MDSATLQEVSVNFNAETNGLLTLPLAVKSKNIITFYIEVLTIHETKEYKAEEGMTWEQWCQSEYNTDNWGNGGICITGFGEIWNEGSFDEGGEYNVVNYNGLNILPTDIVKPVTYTTYVDRWGFGRQ